MAIVKPFKGIRPSKEYADKVASPPYDVLDRDEVKELTKNNPYSFLHITRAEVDFPDEVDEHDEKVYKKARENLEKFLREKILIQDPENYFYIYRQIWKDHIQTGIVAVTSCEEYKKGIIRKHELTRKDKEEDRTKNILITGANTGPVFLTFNEYENEIDKIIDEFISKSEPEYDIIDEKGVRHIFYVLKNKEIIENIEKIFDKVSILYIADGHHRSAAAANVWELKKKEPDFSPNAEYNYFLSVIFPSSHLKILPYNRAVKTLNGLTKEQFIEKIKQNFHIDMTQIKSPSKPHEISMYIDGEWYLLKVKNEKIPADPVNSLDVSLLQNLLLSPILGIENPRTDKRIKFVGGIRGVEELEHLVNDKGFKVAFSMYPTTIEQLINVAANNGIMPPKSTWFEPKLRSGLVIHSIED